MKALRIDTRHILRGVRALPKSLGVMGILLPGATMVFAQPDYAPAHYVPMTGCSKWYTSGNGHHFCVIHDMEGYYWTTISYLNSCSVTASIHYMANGLQNGSDNVGHRENNPTDPAAGDLTQSVREQYYAYHALCWNRWMFGTEHEGFVSTPAWYTEEMYQASAGLQRHLCDTWGIPKDRNHIIGHDEKRSAAWVSWMSTNYPAINATCNSHTDPGQYWDWPHFMSLINSTAPVISAQPESQVVNLGANASFNVTASGATPMSYQWRMNATNIAGATASSYTRSNVQIPDVGYYSVFISNQLGSVTSTDAVLNVNTAPFITSQPQDQSVMVGQGVTLAVAAWGAPPLGYQWRKSGTDIAGATTPTFSLASAQSADGGLYSVMVTNSLGSIASSNATLAVVSLAGVGDNSWGQSGSLPSMTNVIAISTGPRHSLGLRNNGTVLAWGYNFNGECDVPPNVTNALAIAAGGYHSLALLANGSVTAWGNDDSGQAGVPPTVRQVIGISAGTLHSLALSVDGTVSAWGDNTWGQCNVPGGLSNVVAVAAGGNHSLALRADGTVVGWGENTDANGEYAGQAAPPPGLGKVVSLGAGEYHSLAVQMDGTVVAWGDDFDGQCDAPLGLSNVVAVAGGGAHTLALRMDGSVVAWGADWAGQCELPASLADVIAIGAGDNNSIALVAGNVPLANLLSPVWQSGRFRALAQTLNRKSYALEYTLSLAGPTWAGLMTNAGNGALRVLSDTNATDAHRFYRLRQW